MSQNDKNDSLSEKADAAFRQASAKVVQRAKQTGTPVVVWDEGHVKELETEQLETSGTDQKTKDAKRQA